MTTQDHILNAMHKCNCYEGLVKLYHRWFGDFYTYVGYNLETLYIYEDLEADINDWTYKGFFSQDTMENYFDVYKESEE